MNNSNSTAPPGPPGFASVGPYVPLPVNYTFYCITLLILTVNFVASIALYISRRSFHLLALPCLKQEDPRKKAWLQHLVITALMFYCTTNLISAALGTAGFVLLEKMQIPAFIYVNAVDIGFYFLSACLSFVLVGGLILLWLNIAVVWFNMFVHRSMASRMCFWLVVGSLIFFIGVGVISTLFTAFLTFFAPYSPVISATLSAYQFAQMPITFGVSFILFVYGVAIGIRVIMIMKEGISSEDYQGPLLKKRNVMIRKVLLVLLGVAASLIVRLVGLLIAMNITSLYSIFMLFTRAVPDATTTWGFVVLFWPYKSAKIVTIDAPDIKELKKEPRKVQEMKPMDTSSASSPSLSTSTTEAGATTSDSSSLPTVVNV